MEKLGKGENLSERVLERIQKSILNREYLPGELLPSEKEMAETFGVGKSSILNALIPGINIETGEVSERLGRGKHTTRHVELYDLGEGTFIADTPGFASLDMEMICEISKEGLQHDFIDFAPYIGKCRFNDCAHLKEPGCAVTAAVAAGEIATSRYSSYQRLYEIVAQRKSWES